MVFHETTIWHFSTLSVFQFVVTDVIIVLHQARRLLPIVVLFPDWRYYKIKQDKDSGLASAITKPKRGIHLTDNLTKK